MAARHTPAAIYDKDFFEGQAERSLISARIILGRLVPLLRPRRLLDVGCGVGSWMRAGLDLGVEEAIGIDGDYVDRDALLVDAHSFIASDLATQALPDILRTRARASFDLVVCMEVAEHLPHGRAPSLIAELASLGDAVLFSAAVPFQYGTHHVNEQWPEYWSILFRGQGYSCFDFLRGSLWANADVDWWYAQNTLVFARDGSAAADALPQPGRADGRGLSLIHPENLLANLLGLPRRFRQDAAAEEAADFRRLVTANLGRDVVPPSLMATARAAASTPEARNVFPWTRTETYQPEQDIADLSRQLGETGDWLAAANAAFVAERERRLGAEAAERDIRPLREQLQAQAAARLHAETKLADWQAAEMLRRDARAADAAAEREAARAELAATRDVLEQQALALDAREAALQQRDIDIDARLADVDAARRSRLVRVGVGAQRVGRLLSRSTRGLPPPEPDYVEPPQQTEVSQSEEMLAEPPPEKPQIQCFGRYVGEVNWWTLAAAVTRLRRFEVFDVEDYLRRNPDVAAAGVDPYEHFIQSGALEGRGKVDPEDLARLMSGFMLFDHAVRALPPSRHDDQDLPALVEDVSHVGIYVSTHGNVFMDDLAEDLAADLRSAGVRVELLDETSAIETRPPVCVFVAPHEFFVLGRGSDWVRDDVLSDAFMFGTEQVQTTWFQLALPFILMSRGMFDICSQTADLFERLDMAALHVLPGARLRPHKLTERDRRHPLYGVLPAAAQRDIDPGLPFAARPLDISFFGTSSARRDRFFARNAAFFADYETFNYNRRPGRGPIRSEGEDGALTRLAGHVSGHSKITLNIHREEFGYFEWHRMVRIGMCSGSLIVSDPCLPHPSFVANEHYLQESARHIPDLLEWLLTTEEGGREAERVRANVNALISTTFETRNTVAGMLRFLSRHRARERG